ncbi:MAG TPA: Flp family type IVb pilin [Allosphingosinicella sp.]|nr:Flp family type IVb pilin [Allosphingosinicella sp.]
MYHFNALLRNERGATAIEYALIMGLIAMVLIAALNSIGLSLSDIFNTATDAMAGR